MWLAEAGEGEKKGEDERTCKTQVVGRESWSVVNILSTPNALKAHTRHQTRCFILTSKSFSLFYFHYSFRTWLMFKACLPLARHALHRRRYFYSSIPRAIQISRVEVLDKENARLLGVVTKRVEERNALAAKVNNTRIFFISKI